MPFPITRGRIVYGGARARRAGLAVVTWTVGAAMLPHAVRWATLRVSPRGDAFALEWWSAVAWLGVVTLGACLAVRCGVARQTIVTRWPAWRAGAMRFACCAGALAALAGTHASWSANVFDADRALTLARSALLPALTEELAFRGVLAAVVGSLLVTVVREHRVRAALSLAVVSFAFALAHEGATWPAVGWPLIAARSAAGLVFGALALRDRTLLAAMLAHAMYDAAVARCW